jgi:hypothetical protein
MKEEIAPWLDDLQNSLKELIGDDSAVDTSVINGTPTEIWPVRRARRSWPS